MRDAPSTCPKLPKYGRLSIAIQYWSAEEKHLCEDNSVQYLTHEMLLQSIFPLAALVTIWLTPVVQAAPDHSVVIWTWPLDGTPQQLAKVSIDVSASTAIVESYTPPQLSERIDSILRIGFYDPMSSDWRGVVSSSSSFDSSNQPNLVLHTTATGEVYHLGFESTPKPKSAAQTQDRSEKSLSVEIRKATPGPTPHLNKPIVLSPDGRLPEKEPEKTFLQKYWWALGLFLLVQIVMGGGK